VYKRSTKYIVLAPALLIVALTVAYPLGTAFVTSLRRWRLSEAFEPQEFIGATNYLRALNDAVFWNSVWVTVLFTVLSVVLTLVLALAIALVLQGPGKLKMVVKITLILPYAVAPALKGFSWRFMLNQEYGVYDWLVKTVFPFMEGTVWLGSSFWALFSIAMSEVWGWAPLIALMFVGALGGISPEVHEAGRVDGANRWQTLWRITLPMMWPVIAIATLLKSIFSFKMFDQVVTMTGGGPGRSTQTMNHLIYQQGFSFLDMGYSSAMAVLLVVMLTAFAAIYVRVLMKEAT
jgi:multiple sugar transport system permease protein